MHHICALWCLAPANAQQRNRSMRMPWAVIRNSVLYACAGCSSQFQREHGSIHAYGTPCGTLAWLRHMEACGAGGRSRPWTAGFTPLRCAAHECATLGALLEAAQQYPWLRYAPGSCTVAVGLLD